jgi:peptidoglycan lytic transglycosylase
VFIALMGAALPACVHSADVADKPASRAVARTPSPNQVAAVTPTQSRVARNGQATRTNSAPGGLASFYSHGSRTASGERFNARELTAAHPTLPFGTKVRVTDVNSGRSVTVRVNDRGPFVKGRVIDVSHAAAESLGMVGKGVTQVKLDVVQ